jgi:FAD/FMN-containing dehydrogenase
MTDLIERTLRRLGGQLPDRVSRPGDDRYAAATLIWPKPVGRTPRAVVHCRTPEDVQSAIRAARDCHLPLSVRGGGHDWPIICSPRRSFSRMDASFSPTTTMKRSCSGRCVAAAETLAS